MPVKPAFSGFGAALLAAPPQVGSGLYCRQRFIGELPGASWQFSRE
jgi:hypothetical protein